MNTANAWGEVSTKSVAAVLTDSDADRETRATLVSYTAAGATPERLACA